MTYVALFGDTGMVGQEIERILDHHDLVEIGYRQNSQRQVGDLDACSLAFLATKDPESMTFAVELVKKGKRVIDMSGAFRLTKELFEAWYDMDHTAPDLLKEAVYGMPAISAEQIRVTTPLAGAYQRLPINLMRISGGTISLILQPNFSLTTTTSPRATSLPLTNISRSSPTSRCNSITDP